MGRITDCIVSVGSPPPPSSLGLSGDEWKSFLFHIHDFEYLSTATDHYIQTPEFTCDGRLWRVRVYPGGDRYSQAPEDRKVSACLQHLSGKSGIPATFRIDIVNIDKFGKTKKVSSMAKTEGFAPEIYGYDNIASHFIVDGSQDIDSGCLSARRTNHICSSKSSLQDYK